MLVGKEKIWSPKEIRAIHTNCTPMIIVNDFRQIAALVTCSKFGKTTIQSFV